MKKIYKMSIQSAQTRQTVKFLMCLPLSSTSRPSSFLNGIFIFTGTLLFSLVRYGFCYWIVGSRLKSILKQWSRKTRNGPSSFSSLQVKLKTFHLSKDQNASEENETWLRKKACRRSNVTKINCCVILYDVQYVCFNVMAYMGKFIAWCHSLLKSRYSSK